MKRPNCTYRFLLPFPTGLPLLPRLRWQLTYMHRRHSARPWAASIASTPSLLSHALSPPLSSSQSRCRLHPRIVATVVPTPAPESALTENQNKAAFLSAPRPHCGSHGGRSLEHHIGTCIYIVWYDLFGIAEAEDLGRRHIGCDLRRMWLVRVLMLIVVKRLVFIDDFWLPLRTSIFFNCWREQGRKVQFKLFGMIYSTYPFWFT